MTQSESFDLSAQFFVLSGPRQGDSTRSWCSSPRKGGAHQAVNTELVGGYWKLGGYISRKIASAEWGDGVVNRLAATIAREYPGQRGFTRPNLFRMRQFFEAYRDDKKVAPLARQLPEQECPRTEGEVQAISSCLPRIEMPAVVGRMAQFSVWKGF